MRKTRIPSIFRIFLTTTNHTILKTPKPSIMILYNVTVNIDSRIQDEWVEWMQAKHIPDVMATGLFLEYKLSLVLGEEGTAMTYAVQYLCKDMRVFEEYQLKHAKRLQKEHSDRYKGQYNAFRTLLRVISQDKIV